jgi:exosortase/archaeosortase family protein
MRFGITLLVYFLLLMGGFEATRGTAVERFVVETAILKPTVALIDAVTPGEQVRLVGRTFVSPEGSSLRVTRGCEGIEMFLMLAAGILAFPANLSSRVRGFIGGALLAYLLSIGRLMVLHYILRYSPSLWESLHGFILPLGPLVLMAAYFLAWSSHAATESPSGRAAHAI